MLPKKILTKNGQEILLTIPSLTYITELTRYANELSSEDTFLTLSGEEVTEDEESAYVRQIIDEIAKGNRFHVFGFAARQMVANAEVKRVTKSRKRALHVGEIAISVTRVWRGMGIGREILKTLIEAGRQMNLRLLTLSAFANNTNALNLYRSLGFKIAGEVPGAILYRGEYIGHVQMYLSLA